MLSEWVEQAIHHELRERAAALEELAILARRDGCGMVVMKRHGVIVDARVDRYAPVGTAYIIDLSALERPIASPMTWDYS